MSELIKSETSTSTLTNAQICEALHDVADLLQNQGSTGVRIGAYRLAAETILQLPEQASELLERDGVAGLEKLDGVGHSLANHIAEYIRTGHLSTYQRLQQGIEAERLIATVPDIGSELAHRIYEQLHIEDLVQLKAAAEDGRLTTLKGVGPKRVQTVLQALTVLLSETASSRNVESSGEAGVDRLNSGGEGSAEPLNRSGE